MQTLDQTCPVPWLISILARAQTELLQAGKEKHVQNCCYHMAAFLRLLLNTVLHNKYIHTLELGQLFLPVRHSKGTCWLLSLQSALWWTTVKGKQKDKERSSCCGHRSWEKVTCGHYCWFWKHRNFYPWLLGKCYCGLAQCLAHGCCDQNFPFCCGWGMAVHKFSNQVWALV